MIENCIRDGSKRFLNVIIDWTEQEVWEFIKKFNLPYCKLYDEGWKRIGCLFCPFSSSKMKMLMAKRYPSYTKAFIKAFERLYQDSKKKDLKSVDKWQTGEEMFWWWIKGTGDKKNFDQTVMFE